MKSKIFIFIASISFMSHAMQPIPKVATGPLIIEDSETEDIYCNNSFGTCVKKKKFCLICLKEEKKSRVYDSAEVSVTSLKCAKNFWGTDGRFREQERCNTQTEKFRCSNGHTWAEETRVY